MYVILPFWRYISLEKDTYFSHFEEYSFKIVFFRRHDIPGEVRRGVLCQFSPICFFFQQVAERQEES